MIINMQTQNIDVSKFEIAVDFFKSTLFEASEFILNKITKNIKMQNDRLKVNCKYYENNTSLLLDENMIKEYDQLETAADVYEVLLKEVEEYKDKSPAFMSLYTAIDEYYTSLVVLPIDLGFLEAQEYRKIKKC